MILTAASVRRIGLTPCGRFGIGELDCLFCALRCLHGESDATIRDAHVWLFWAGMPASDPREGGRS